MRGDSTELFSRTAPGRLFFIAALPGAVSMLASALYQLLDGIFVGHYLGDTPFAALNLAMPFVIINFALADLIGVGSAVPISVIWAAARDARRTTFFTCASLLIVLSGVVMAPRSTPRALAHDRRWARRASSPSSPRRT